MFKALFRRFRQTPYFLTWLRWWTGRRQVRYQGQFDGIETVCLFIGHGRSGHSLVAALLDAHPQVAMADEIDSLRLVGAGFGRDQYLTYLLDAAERQGQAGRVKGGKTNPPYAYSVPGQWQGRWQELKVVGEASLATAYFHETPALLDRLERLGMGSLKFIQVVRNPFDGISRLSLLTNHSLDKTIDHYFWVCERVRQFRAAHPDAAVFILRLEDLIARPRQTLADLGEYLGLSMTADYLEACQAIIFPKPHQTRQELSWLEAEIEKVRVAVQQYDFLKDYDCHDSGEGKIE